MLLADLLVGGLIALTAYIIFFGGFRTTVFGVLVSIRSPIRLLAEALVVGAIRSWLYRKVTLIGTLGRIGGALSHRAGNLNERILKWPAGVWTMAIVALTTRLSVLFIGFVAVLTIGYPSGAPAWRVSSDELWNLPARWDSGWYRWIAQLGYNWQAGNHGQQNIVFFPAFPLVTRAATWLLWGNLEYEAQVLWSGVIVSVIAFAIALIYLYHLVREWAGDDSATATAVLIATYPFALFYSAAYTESLFLLAIVGTFYHFSRGQFWRAAAFGLLTGLVRPNGWMASASLALLAVPFLGWLKLPPWLGRLLSGTTRVSSTAPVVRLRLVPMLAAIAAPSIGLLIYCAYMYHLTGDPFMWAKLMQYWGRDFSGLAMLRGDLDNLGANGIVGYVARSPLDAMNAMGLVFGLVTVWPVTRRLGLAYGLFVLVNIALPATSGGLVSIGRYSSVLFPSFVWLALVTPQRARPALISVWALSQGLAAALFFTWRSIY